MSLSADAVTDPVGTIVALVAAVDPAIEAGALRRVVEQVGGGRAKRRRLAAELAADPSVLSTGRSPASKAAGDLLLALRAAGAAGVAPPGARSAGGRSPRCSAAVTTGTARRASPGPRSAPAAGTRARPPSGTGTAGRGAASAPTTIPATRETCWSPIITSADPGLDVGTVNTVLRQVVTKAAHLQKLAWALDEAPALLTGDGARAAFPMVLRLIDALCEAGATRIQRPACPLCGRVVTLSKLLNGLAGLPRLHRPLPRRPVQPVRTRAASPPPASPDGQPLCPYCLVSDPVNLEDCVRCGRRQRVGHPHPGRAGLRQLQPPPGPDLRGLRPDGPVHDLQGHRPALVPACARSWACCSRCGNLAPDKGRNPRPAALRRLRRPRRRHLEGLPGLRHFRTAPGRGLPPLPPPRPARPPAGRPRRPGASAPAWNR